MTQARITVYTPTYNRAYILSQCYESLKRQTCQDFIWVVVDDGSIDNTEELVSEWIKENCVRILYRKHEKNMGLQVAHNTAHSMINTELCILCDSDDYLADDCIEKVLRLWEENGSDKYCGIIGLSANHNGKVWDEIPKTLKDTTLYDLRYI